MIINLCKSASEKQGFWLFMRGSVKPPKANERWKWPYFPLMSPAQNHGVLFRLFFSVTDGYTKFVRNSGSYSSHRPPKLKLWTDHPTK